MNPQQPGVSQPEPVSIFCTQCGQAMRVAPEHMQTVVACPHCGQAIDPQRVAGTVPGSRPATFGPPPGAAPGYGYGSHGLTVYSWRNRWVAGLLGIFLGPLGVHRMYLGFVGIGILQIVVTFVTLGIGGIWGFIEGVLCLCGAMRDVDGLPLRE